MRWLVLMIVVASLPAHAHPVRIDRDFYKPEPACPRTASWAKLARCQFKAVKVELLQDLPTAKLVAYQAPGYERGTKHLELYLLANRAWVKSGFYADTNAQTELLAFKPAGDRYRLDMGYASATWVSTDEVSSRPAMLKRQFTYFCSATAGCTTVMTSCDVLVHGKAIASFRGEPQWDGNTLRIRGDGRNTNRYCTRPPNLIESDG